MKYINNQTVKFIMPLVLNLPKSIVLREDFLGAFVGDVSEPKYDGNILLAYKVPTRREDIKFEIDMRHSDNYVTSYDYDDKRIVVYVFNIPNNSIETVENVMSGLYSKILPQDKLKISKFWTDKHSSSLPSFVDVVLDEDKQAIKEFWEDSNRDPKDYCLNGEYWFIPKIEDELFFIEDYN